MQFYLNGYKAGDPDVLPAAAEKRPTGLPDAVDVLIVGSGPAGTVLAAQLSAFPSINARLVERRTIELPQQRGTRGVFADEARRKHVAIARAVLQRDAPDPATRLRGGARVGREVMSALARHRPGTVAG